MYIAIRYNFLLFFLTCSSHNCIKANLESIIFASRMISFRANNQLWFDLQTFAGNFVWCNIVASKMTTNFAHYFPGLCSNFVGTTTQFGVAFHCRVNQVVLTEVIKRFFGIFGWFSVKLLVLLEIECFMKTPKLLLDIYVLQRIAPISPPGSTSANSSWRAACRCA